MLKVACEMTGAKSLAEGLVTPVCLAFCTMGCGDQMPTYSLGRFLRVTGQQLNKGRNNGEYTMNENECLPLTWFIKKQNSPRESHSTGGRPTKPGTPSSRSPYIRRGPPWDLESPQQTAAQSEWSRAGGREQADGCDPCELSV